LSFLPFALRRPWLLLRDSLIDRDRPDLARLRAIEEPEAFVWAILPHAARTFSSGITLLPAAKARAAAVGYLYCRILDTYEDLLHDPAARESALRAFAGRFPGPDLAPPPALAAPQLRDHREPAHVLLVERCGMVDRVFATLSAERREAVAELVRAMAAGMIETAALRDRQGGALRDAAQLTRYCDHVLGNPVRFALRLIQDRELDSAQRADTVLVGEFLQLANVSRDLEKDLAHGVAWHADFEPWLGTADAAARADPRGWVERTPGLLPAVRRTRAALLCRALELAPAYQRMTGSLPPRCSRLAVASTVIMLLFTDRYYRKCAGRAGLAPWGPRQGNFALLLDTLACYLSRSRARRRTARAVAGMQAALASYR